MSFLDLMVALSIAVWPISLICLVAFIWVIYEIAKLMVKLQER